MGRKRIYSTPEEAYKAKLEKARARYHQKKGSEQEYREKASKQGSLADDSE